MLQFLWFMLLTFFLQTEGEGEEGTEEEEEGTEEESEEEGEEEGEEEVKDPAAKLKAESEKNARLSRKLRKQERDSKKLEDRLKEIENQNKSEDEKKDEERKKEQEEHGKLQTDFTRVYAERLLLDNDEVSGQSKRKRKMILRLLTDEVEVDEDGDDNVQDLLDDLKKEEPDLFLTSSNGEGGNDEETTEPRASGRKVGGTKRKDKNTIDDAKLRERFRVLRTR